MKASPKPPAPRHIPGLDCAVCGAPARRNLRREAFDEVYLFCSAACIVLFDEAPSEFAFARGAAEEG